MQESLKYPHISPSRWRGPEFVNMCIDIPKKKTQANTNTNKNSGKPQVPTQKPFLVEGPSMSITSLWRCIFTDEYPKSYKTYFDSVP